MSAGYTPPADQPVPDYYQMLGIVHFESDPQAIHVATDGRIIHVRSFQSGPHVEQIVQELNVARSVLLDPQLKAAYDAQLHQQIYPPAIAPVPESHTLTGQPPEFVNQEQMASPVEQPGLDFESSAEPSSATRSKRRRSKRSLWIAIGLNILGPVLGLCGGYAVLCWISPRYDFLHLLPPDHGSPSANEAPGTEPIDPAVLEADENDLMPEDYQSD